MGSVSEGWVHLWATSWVMLLPPSLYGAHSLVAVATAAPLRLHHRIQQQP
jgi:hypothetical protein